MKAPPQDLTVFGVHGMNPNMNPKFSLDVVPNKRGSCAIFQFKMVSGVYFADQNRYLKDHL